MLNRRPIVFGLMGGNIAISASRAAGAPSMFPPPGGRLLDVYGRGGGAIAAEQHDAVAGA